MQLRNVGSRLTVFALFFFLGLGGSWALLVFNGLLAGLSLATSWVRITLYATAFGLALAVRGLADPETSPASRAFWRIAPFVAIMGLLVATIVTQNTTWLVAMLAVSAGWAWLVATSTWTARPRNPWPQHPLGWRCVQGAVYFGCLAVTALLIATIGDLARLTGPWMHLLSSVLVFGVTALVADRLLGRLGRRSVVA